MRIITKEIVKAKVAEGILKYMKANKETNASMGEKIGVDPRAIFNYYHELKEPTLSNYLKMVKVGVEFNLGV